MVHTRCEIGDNGETVERQERAVDRDELHLVVGHLHDGGVRDLDRRRRRVYRDCPGVLAIVRRKQLLRIGRGVLDPGKDLLLRATNVILPVGAIGSLVWSPRRIGARGHLFLVRWRIDRLGREKDQRLLVVADQYRDRAFLVLVADGRLEGEHVSPLTANKVVDALVTEEG